MMGTIREELGPDADFAVDLHWYYDVRDAVDLAKALEPVHPMWIEDPVPPANPETMALVRKFRQAHQQRRSANTPTQLQLALKLYF